MFDLGKTPIRPTFIAVTDQRASRNACFVAAIPQKLDNSRQENDKGQTNRALYSVWQANVIFNYMSSDLGLSKFGHFIEVLMNLAQ
jgi:hypothetical protein